MTTKSGGWGYFMQCTGRYGTYCSTLRLKEMQKQHKNFTMCNTVQQGIAMFNTMHARVTTSLNWRGDISQVPHIIIFSGDPFLNSLLTFAKY